MKAIPKNKYCPKVSSISVKPFFEVLVDYLRMRPNIKELHLYPSQIARIQREANDMKASFNGKEISVMKRLHGVKLVEVPVPINYTRPKGYRLKRR